MPHWGARPWPAHALELGDQPMLERLRVRLAPAAAELAAGSGMLTFGPVERYLG